MNVKNTYKKVFRKTFLIEKLPKPLTPADSHLQLFDNYVENTRIRLRRIRVPETKQWTRILEQVYPIEENNFSRLKISQMFLNESEYIALEHLNGREIRKNRYYFEYENKQLEIDIFLGKLWGLNIVNVYFDTEEELENYKLPEFSALDVTKDGFFSGEVLVDKKFSDIQDRISNI